MTIVLLGMRGLAVQLSNPFGNDSVDFDVEKMMQAALKNTESYLRSDRRATCSKDPPESRREPKNPLMLTRPLGRASKASASHLPSQMCSLPDIMEYRAVDLELGVLVWCWRRRSLSVRDSVANGP